MRYALCNVCNTGQNSSLAWLSGYVNFMQHLCNYASWGRAIAIRDGRPREDVAWNPTNLTADSSGRLWQPVNSLDWSTPTTRRRPPGRRSPQRARELRLRCDCPEATPKESHAEGGFSMRRPARNLPPVKPATPPPDRLTLRLNEVAQGLGVSRRSLERERAAGRFPPPDLTIGRMPLWRLESVREWVEEGGGR
jgi:predicted DNA-binding transcriptional regulator AlpA